MSALVIDEIRCNKLFLCKINNFLSHSNLSMDNLLEVRCQDWISAIR